MDSNATKLMSRNSSMGKISPPPDTVRHTVVSEEKFFEERYEMLEKLGEGSFGVVYEAVNRETSERCACKIVHKEKTSGHRLALREVALLKKVQHEHIIRLKEVFEIQQKIFLVMELCEKGELAKLVHSRRTLSESETRIVMSRLINAIAYLHKQGLVHRDLKLENILLSRNPGDDDDEFYIKVTDFGLSIRKAGNTADDMMDEFCGTPMYMAPEILENKTYSEKCDVWAMGVIMCILLTGVPPFQGESDLREADIKAKFADKSWKNISKEAKDCIERMLIQDPAPRMTAFELLDHPWIKGLQLDTQAQGPRNVLEMMKEYRKESESAEATTAANGETPSASSNNAQSTNAKLNTAVKGPIKVQPRAISSVTNHSKSRSSATDLLHNSPQKLGSSSGSSHHVVGTKTTPASARNTTRSSGNHARTNSSSRTTITKLTPAVSQKSTSSVDKKTMKAIR